MTSEFRPPPGRPLTMDGYYDGRRKKRAEAARNSSHARSYVRKTLARLTWYNKSVVAILSWILSQVVKS